MRLSRIISYAAGWAAMTALAGGVVWWGLGPLLEPIMRNAAAPVQPSPSATSHGPTPSSAPTSPSPSRSVSPSPDRLPDAPQPSTYAGWQVIDGAFVQTFVLEGGEATVRIVAGRVELVSSQPAHGYTITPRQPSRDRLVLEFFNGVDFFILDTMWWQNHPYAKLTQVP